MGVQGSTVSGGISARVWGTAIATAIVAAISCFVFGFAEASAATVSPASEPAADGKAGIVFSNGGRIVRINTDGSGRAVLTRKNALKGGPVKTGVTSSLFVGDVGPRISPDGSRILFKRVLGLDGDPASGDTRMMISRIDGSAVRRVLKPRGNVTFEDADWMPDGERLVAARWVETARRTERSIVVARPDGTVLRTVVRLRPFIHRNSGRTPMKIPAGLAVSPDGSALLVTVRKEGRNTSGTLERIDLETGNRNVVAKQSRDGAWSPDGSRVLFVSTRDRNGCVDAYIERCSPAGEIYTAAPDGSELTRVTKTRADESSPAWSPDGERIAFASNRNRPRSGVAREIYSMATDGSCLTWLTNGTPASVWPAWSGPADGEYGPGSCGATKRTPLTELKPRYRDLGMAKPRLWLGPQFEGRLFSDFVDLVFLSMNVYEDCGESEPSRCRPPLAVESLPVCFIGDQYVKLLNRLPKLRLRNERGATVATNRNGRGSVMFSGGALAWPMKLWSGNKPKPLPRALDSKAMRAMRPYGASRPGRLPPVRVPAPVLRKMLKVERAVRGTGSTRKAARALKMKPGQVTRYRRALRSARRLGPLRRQRCNKRLVNDPWELDGGIGGARAARVADLPASPSTSRLPSALPEPVRGLLRG